MLFSFFLYECVTGLFMALQPRVIACGNSTAAFAMAVRFLTGPAVMAAASVAVKKALGVAETNEMKPEMQ